MNAVIFSYCSFEVLKLVIGTNGFEGFLLRGIAFESISAICATYLPRLQTPRQLQIAMIAFLCVNSKSNRAKAQLACNMGTNPCTCALTGRFC